MSDKLEALWFSQRPGPTTNPYITQLVDALTPSVNLTFFSWRKALLGRYDLVHVHWPEIKLEGRTRARRVANRALMAVLLTKLTMLRVPIVRTAHNLSPHEETTRIDRMLLDWIDRRTAVWIRLGDHTPPAARGLTVTIPHGHYVDWFSRYCPSPRVPRRVAYVGLIRAYKGVEELVDTFGDVALPGASMHVSGRAQNADLEHEIRRLARGDNRIQLDLSYISEAQMVAEVTEAEVVVLPYRDLHNSGTLLLALSLGRPVLVPSNLTTEAVAAEVGRAWVMTFEGPLSAAVITDALNQSAALAATGQRPDLSARDWTSAGVQHVAAYEAAVRVARPGAGRRYSE